MLRRNLAGLSSSLVRSRVSVPQCPRSQSRSFCASSERVSGDGGSSTKKRWSDWLLLAVSGGGFATYYVLYHRAMGQDITCKAIDMACQDQKFLEAIGEPVMHSPWYLVGYSYYYIYWKNSLRNCVIQVSGPQGSGILSLKAARTGEDSWLIFWRHDDWKIQEMEVKLRVSTKPNKYRTLSRIVPDAILPSLRGFMPQEDSEALDK